MSIEINCEICANELRLFIEATKVARGYEVCDNCYYDLVAEKFHHFCRIQVKCTEKVTLTVQHHGPHYAFSLSHGNLNKEAYTKEHIDFFVF